MRYDSQIQDFFLFSRFGNFFYNVSGEESERLLYQYGVDGDFLARRSESQPDNYTLTILREGTITHVKVINNQGRFNLPGGTSFDTLCELVAHYIQFPEKLQLTEGGTIVMKKPVSIPLTEPAAVEARNQNSHRWFHTNLSGEEASKLLQNEKTWSYLVRESIRTPGCYAITVKTSDDIVHILINKNPKTGKFSVGGVEEFNAVLDLIAHHSIHPMVEERTHRVLYLKNQICSTVIPADTIDDRIRLLSKTGPTKNGFWDEFNRLQQDEQLKSKREGKRDINLLKNRYRNIVPFDHSRVVLREFCEPRDRSETDYINANYIKVSTEYPDVSQIYISTQGCMEQTVIDFWRMVWQEDTRVIVMTTRLVERGKDKCFQYWPELKKEMNIRGYYIKNVDEELVKDEDDFDIFVKRRFMMSRCGAPQREVFHLQFVGWPDHGCPDRPESVLRFLEAANDCYKLASSRQGPRIVHCSAGIGRTGAFIAIDVLTTLIQKRGVSTYIDIHKMVAQIRDQRSGMVQTDDQYAFIYRAVSAFVKKSLANSDGHPLFLPPPPIPRRNKSGSTESEL